MIYNELLEKGVITNSQSATSSSHIASQDSTEPFDEATTWEASSSDAPDNYLTSTSSSFGPIPMPTQTHYPQTYYNFDRQPEGTLYSKRWIQSQIFCVAAMGPWSVGQTRHEGGDQHLHVTNFGDRSAMQEPGSAFALRQTYPPNTGSVYPWVEGLSKLDPNLRRSHSPNSGLRGSYWADAQSQANTISMQWGQIQQGGIASSRAQSSFPAYHYSADYPLREAADAGAEYSDKPTISSSLESYYR